MDTSLQAGHGIAVPPGGGAAQSMRRLHLLLFVLFLSGTLLLLARGWEFYSLAVGERVDHPDFRMLSPGSNLGHGYGIAGTLLILTNLLYLVRRRFARLSVGSLKVWLDVHVFTGLFGGMLVLFHSAFQVRSSMAVVTVSSLLVVIVTGLLGRYLYSLSPKPDRQRLEQHLRALDVIGPGMGQILAQRLAQVPITPAPARSSLLSALGSLPGHRRELRQRRGVIAHTVAQYAQHFGAEVLLLSKPIAECTRLYTAEVRASAASTLLKSWRGVHRFAALLLVLLVILHIAVVWYYGFVWVFSR